MTTTRNDPPEHATAASRAPDAPPPDHRGSARHGWCAGLACVTLLLAACGGGGGGTDAPASPPGGTSSGLVPAAPTLGEVLHEDATVLRPLAAGAEWHYHGTFRYLPTEQLIATYRNQRVQRSTASGLEEEESNSANAGPYTTQLQARNGRIEVPTLLELPGRAPEAVVGIELRSPVRVGDQVVSYDRRIENIADLDGDGRADAIDAAVFARVIGREQVNLPTLPAVQAVRVEVSTLVRARYTRDNSLSPLDVTVQRVWYAPGLGIVRTQLEETSDRYLSRVLAEEWLVAHERSGFALGPGRAVQGLKAGEPVFTRSPSAWRARETFTWADRILVVAETGFSERQLTAFDRAGQVLADGPAAARLRNGVQGDDGVAFLNRTTFGAGAAYVVHAVDRDGRFVGPPSGVSVDLDDSPSNPMVIQVRNGAAYENRRLWLSYSTSARIPGTNDYINRNGLRAIDVTTGAFATPFVDLGMGEEPASPLVAAGGALHQVRTRVESDGSKTLRLLTLPVAPLGNPRWQVLASGLAADTVLAFQAAALADGGAVLAWRGLPDFTSSSGGSWFGIQVRPDGRMLRSSGSAGDRLSGIPANHEWLGVRGNRAWFARGEYESILPGLDGTGLQSVVALDLRPDQPWAETPARQARVQLLGPAPDGQNLAAFGTFWLDDRALLLGGFDPQAEGVETRFRWAAQPWLLPATTPGS